MMSKENKYDYIIVGTGFAGSVLAHKLATEQSKRILMIEQRAHIGGNCFDYIDENGINVHKYGPHLFHTNNTKVYEYLKQFTKFENYEHMVLAYIDGKNVNIPFNFNTLYQLFSKEKAHTFEKALLEQFNLNEKIPILELKKTPNEDLQYLANYIYEKMFVNYTAKQWGVKPEEIDSAVTARVPVFVGKDNRYFHDTYQVIPTEGYSEIFEKMLSADNIKILLNTKFGEICELKDNVIYYNGQEFKGNVIYTGPIDELFDYKYGTLAYRSIDLQFETVEKEYFQEAAVINYPNDYTYTRITEFKHIHPVETPKTTILKEYPQEHIVGKNIRYYPVFNDENNERYQRYFDLSQNISKLMLVGRLAEFKYYDMDDVIERALERYRLGDV
jgi:UDP-galactopyranose mutase